jgi:hypothetical protein
MMYLAAGLMAVSAAFVATAAAGSQHTPDHEASTDAACGDLGPHDPGLEGTYPAVEHEADGASLYLPGAETVEVEYDRDGYYHVRLRDEAGARVGTGHRAAGRIRGALAGGPGYDYAAPADDP